MELQVKIDGESKIYLCCDKLNHLIKIINSERDRLIKLQIGSHESEQNHGKQKKDAKVNYINLTRTGGR